MKVNAYLCLAGLVFLAASSSSADTVLTNCTDATLRSAVAAGGRITFSCDGIVELSSPLIIQSNTEIDGSGWQVTISGGNSNRIFAVTNSTLRLSNLTLANGKASGTNASRYDDGFNYIILHSTPGYGGAIKAENASLQISDCIFSNNIAKGGQGIPYLGAMDQNAGSPGEGGAVFANNSSLNITNSIFVNNQAEGGGSDFAPGGIRVGAASGGAIATYNTSSQISDSKFENNSAKAGRGNDPTDDGQPAFGGALYFKGGSVTIERSDILKNLAAAAGGKFTISNSAWGGGIYAEANVILSNCSIQENSAQGSLGQPGGDAIGGGLASLAELNMNGSIIRANKTFAGNSGVSIAFPRGPGGSPLGAGVAIYGAAILSNSTFTENNCFEAADKAADSGQAKGGGLYIASTNVQLAFLTIAHNRLTENPTDTSHAQGSGLYVATNGTAELKGTLYAHNLTLRDTPSGPIILSTNDLFGNFIDSGYNLCSDNSLLTNSTSKTNVDPRLGTVGFHGGPTATISLLAESPAIDAAGTNNIPTTDQRGRPRPSGSAADIGAYESSAPYYVSGRIIGAGESVTLTLGATTNYSSSDGTFYIDELPAGQQVLTPVVDKFLFTPVNIPLNIQSDLELQDFHAYRINGFTVEQGPNDERSIVFASEGAGSYDIESSVNLNNWSLDQTESLGEHQLFSIPLIPDSDRKYYRALKH